MSNNGFKLTDARRCAVPLIIGLSGPSGSGKTFSALRLASGIASVTGQTIAVIDTEARRALHYADTFSYQHLDFSAPFASERYLAAIQHCVRAGAGIIVIDSMSHEHDGPGGVLEQHDTEVERLSKGDPKKAQRVTFSAWIQPKRGRNRLLQGIIHAGVHVIMCFRAKEKLSVRPGKEPVQLGWMPIAGDEFAYECQLFASLAPGADGKPTWKPHDQGTQAMVKLPLQFRCMIKDGRQLDEDFGAAMARWAQGDAEEPQPATQPRNASKTDDIAKRIIDAYAPYGVTEDDLRTWLSGPVGAVSDDVVEELREMLSQIKAGKSHPADFFPRLRDIVDDGPPPDDAPHPAEATP